MKLVHKDTLVEVLNGDEVTDFRGDKAIVTGREEPRHSGSTGRVYVRPLDASYEAGYYPSVFNLKWVRNNAHA